MVDFLRDDDDDDELTAEEMAAFERCEKMGIYKPAEVLEIHEDSARLPECPPAS